MARTVDAKAATAVSGGHFRLIKVVIARRPNAIAAGAILEVVLLMAWYTWERWGDLQVDCGRELYVPLEILRGKLL
jgi:hypothetical protein